MLMVIKCDFKRFLKEFCIYYGDVWKMFLSQYLVSLDFVVVDLKIGKKIKVSFVFLDDGEVVGVVYDDFS